MGAPQRLFNHLIDKPELVEAIGGEIERIRGSLFLVLALPQNGRAAFG